MVNILKSDLVLNGWRCSRRYLKFIVPIIFFTLIAVIWVWNVPHLIQARVLHRIELITGYPPLPEQVEYNGNLIMIKNIRLDHEGIETLDSLGVIFSPLSYLGLVKIQSILIDGPAFTRSVQTYSQNPYARINSFMLEKSILTLADTVEIKNATLDLVTDNIGALRFNGEGIIRTDAGTGAKAFQFSIESRQKKFSLEARLSGSAFAEDNWSGELNIDSLSTETAQVHLLRSGGLFRIGGTDETYYLTGEANIGAIKFAGYAFRELAAGIDLTQDSMSWTIGGMAVAEQTVEIGASYNSSESDLVQGSVYAQNLAALTRYLWPEETEGYDLKALSYFQDCFFSYAVHLSDILKTRKYMKISAENFDLAPLANAFPRQINQAEGLVNIQFVLALDGYEFQTTKGIFYSQSPGSIVFTKRGLRDVVGRAVMKNFKRNTDYQNFKIQTTGDILSDQADWKISVAPQNSEEKITVDLNRSALPLKIKVLQ